MATNSLQTCIKCAKYINTEQCYPVLEQNIVTVSVINEWVSPQIITDADYICQLCWKNALEVVNMKLELPSKENEETKTDDKHLDTSPLNLKTETSSTDDEDTENNYVPKPKKIKLESEHDQCNEHTENSCNNNKEKRLINDSLNMCNKDTGNSHDNETIDVKEEPLSSCDEDVEDSNNDNNTTNVKEKPLCTCDKNIENHCYDNVKEELYSTCDIGKENNRHDYDKLYLKEEPVSICYKDSSNNYHENETNQKEAASAYLVADQANTDKETMNKGFASDKITNKTNECYDAIEQARRNGCALCGCSILRRRSTAISREHPTELQELTSTYIHNNAIREITEYDRVCHKCWLRAQRYADKLIKSDTTKIIADSAGNILNSSTKEQGQKTSTLQNLYTAEDPNKAPLQDNPEYSDSDLEWKPSCIKLTDIKRASNTSRHCLFSNCETKSLHLIKNDLRIELLINQNYYVPLGSRICSFHLISNNWDVLFDDSSSKSEFTADHIEHIYSLLKTNRSLSQVNFDDVLNIDKCLLQYWTGLTKEKFIELVNEAPEVRDVHRGLTGLVALLMKHHRGDTYECLAKLMNISSKTLVRLMTTVNELLLKRGDILEAFLQSSQQCKKMPQKKSKNLEILYI